MTDYYKVLGVPRTASVAEIKQTYRRLIKACHPDVNPSPKAVEWSRQLNEAYSVLSDAKTKAAYDLALKLDDPSQGDTTTSRTAANQARTESGPPPKPEPNFCCEKCGHLDSSLRLSVFWRVMSLVYWSRREPITKILCNKCRVKTSLAANAFTFLLGWWGVIGFIWTVAALFENALGGEQPRENNAALLRAVSYQLYKNRRFSEAYKAMAAALKLRPDPKAAPILEQLKEEVQPIEQKSLWNKFCSFELHPFFYHAPAGAVTAAILFICLSILYPGPQLSSSAAPLPQARYASQSQQSAKPIQFTPDPKPAFSEPELPLPEEGGLLFSDNFTNDTSTMAPFKLTTPSDGNYVMKIEDWNTKEFVAMYFIPRSSTLTVDLPVGSYRLKFAQGDKWYGTQYLFGPATTYSYVPDRMDFYVSGDYVRGHEIELVPQINGNLETPSMRAEDW